MNARFAARRVTRAVQARLVPGLRHAQRHFEDSLFRHARSARAWLDVGCGHRLLTAGREDVERALFSRVPLVVGVDADLAALRRHRGLRALAHADARRLPFADGAFDLVTANMVVEHLADPAREFAEIARVLAPGGVFLFHTPNRGSYLVWLARLLPQRLRTRLVKLLDGRDASDVFPTHYRANRAEEVEALARGARLDVAELTFVSTVPATRDVPPVAALELLLIRALERPRRARYRTNLIAALRKPVGRAAGAARA